MRTHPFTSDPTSIAMAGDWHGNAAYARKAIEFAAYNRAQGIVHLGDFGIWPGHSGAHYLDRIATWLNEMNLWLLIVDGNHDDHSQLEALPLDEAGTRPLREGIWHTPRGLRWQWHGRTWLALGGATSLDRKYRTEGRDWWPQEAITMQQAMAVMADGPADVMLTHDCPAGVDIPDLMPDSFWDPHALALANAHRRQLALIVEEVRPQRLWHGHFHVRYSATATFGGQECQIEGLDCDGVALEKNVVLVDVFTQ